MSAWLVRFRSLTPDTLDSVDTLPRPAGPEAQSVKSVHCVSPSETETGAAEAIARGTGERVRIGLAGYPADEIERGEREAIEAEGRGELTVPPQGIPHATYIGGLKHAAGMLFPPRRSMPANWRVPEGAVCTGCRTRATWVADGLPAGRAVLHWRCTRCYPAAQNKEPAA